MHQDIYKHEAIKYIKNIRPLNHDKLKAIFAELGASCTLAQPSDYERQLWIAIKLSIKPHLEGTPPLLLHQTFANESENQKAYRRRVYRSKSKYLLLQSMQDVYKIAQSDDFIVDYPNEVLEVLNRSRIGSEVIGEDIVKKVFATLYIDRVRDPNAYIGIVPYNFDDTIQGRKNYSLELYPSENIMYKSSDCLAFALPNNNVRIYTKAHVILVNSQTELISAFTHNSADLGAYILGGAPQNLEVVITNDSTKIVEVQFSDYSYAVDELDKLENRNSQNEVITNLHAHPRMVARDLTCTTCEGHGDIDKVGLDGLVINQIVNEGKTDIDGRDMSYRVPLRQTCPSCNGKKVINIGTQDVITVPNPTAADPTDGQSTPISDLAKGIIAYISPDITSADYVYTQLKDSEQACKEMLRLQRFEDFGESGAAKRIDQEAGQPRLRAIAEGIQTLIRNLLIGLVNFEYVVEARASTKQNAISQVRVAIPSFFDMLSVSESKENYFLNISQKRAGERYLEERNIIKKQYNSAQELAIFDMAYYYTNGANMLLADERMSLKAAGALSDVDIYVATFIDGIIRNILRTAKDGLNPIDLTQTTKADFALLIDTELQPIITKLAAAKSLQSAAAAAFDDLPMDN